jgi:chorismate mutase
MGHGTNTPAVHTSNAAFKTTNAALLELPIQYLLLHEPDLGLKTKRLVRLLLATVKMKRIAILLAFMPLLPASIRAGTQEQLATYRQQIDSIDQRLVQLIQERARVVQQVGVIKQEAHLPVTDTSREQVVIQKAEDLGKGGPLPPEAVGRIYQKLVEEMRNWEASLTKSEK